MESKKEPLQKRSRSLAQGLVAELRGALVALRNGGVTGVVLARLSVSTVVSRGWVRVDVSQVCICSQATGSQRLGEEGLPLSTLMLCTLVERFVHVGDALRAVHPVLCCAKPLLPCARVCRRLVP